MSKLLKSEAGYSLVEVMASIMILAIAIIPMVSMFDMGLNAASTSGNYDTARAFANKKLEQAKSLPYDSDNSTVTDVKDNFPRTAPATNPTDGSTTSPITSATEPGVPNGFSYTVRKQFLRMATSGGTTNLTSTGATNADGIIQVTVTVSWGTGNSYSTIGVVSRETM